MSIKYAVATTSLNFRQTTNVYLVPFAANWSFKEDRGYSKSKEIYKADIE